MTASFVIGWVIIGPAMLTLDVPAPAAAMFVFYYSVLSEVTPPTALAAVGASALTGGRAVPTMWQALKYALPAFLIPMAFVLTPFGEHLLGRGSLVDIVLATLAGCASVAAMAVATPTGGMDEGAGPVGWPVRGTAALAVCPAGPSNRSGGGGVRACSGEPLFSRCSKPLSVPQQHDGENLGRHR